MKKTQDKIIQSILALDSLNDLKYQKSKKRFYKRDGEKSCNIEFDFIVTKHIISNEYALGLDLSFGVRYNFLHKWLEEFYHSSLSTYRSVDTIFESSSIFREDGIKSNLLYFSLDESRYKIEFNEVEIVINNFIHFFNTKTSLTQIYENEVKPSINNYNNNLRGGIEVFEYLAITKIVAPNNLSLYIKFFKDFQKKQATRGEPNSKFYMPLFDKIIEKLYKTDFKKSLNYL